MNFQTSCMVLVTDEQQQIELEKWMKNIGWQVHLGKDGPCFLIANANEDQALWMDLEGQRTQEIFARGFIDCGSNIELFKALAAMNSDNDREQWFVARAITRFDPLKDIVQTETGEQIAMPGDWFNVLIPQANDIQAEMTPAGTPRWLFHKATKDEIIEHYKNSKA